MLTREILDSHPASTLKKEISKTNIKGYSKMTKKQLIDVMMANKERFGHIKKKEYVPPKRTAPKKAEPPKKPAPKKVMAKPKPDTEPKRPSEPKRPQPKPDTEPKRPSEPKRPQPKPDTEPKRPSEPKRPAPKKETDKERRDRMNKMDPLKLFSQLPDVAKREVERFSGANIEKKFLQLKERGGINKHKKELMEIQREAYKKAGMKTTTPYFIANMDTRTIQSIRKEKGGAEALRRMEDYIDRELKKSQKEFEEKQKRKRGPAPERDYTKITVANVAEEALEALNDRDGWEEMEYSGDLGYDDSSKLKRRRLQLLKPLIKEFLKGKKFKDAEEAGEAFAKANPDYLADTVHQV
jgi:hypothetical protein